MTDVWTIVTVGCTIFNAFVLGVFIGMALP